MKDLPKDRTVTLQLQYRRCGKPTCGTCKIGEGHGPYWYAFWRAEGRLVSAYCGKERPSLPARPRKNAAAPKRVAAGGKKVFKWTGMGNS